MKRAFIVFLFFLLPHLSLGQLFPNLGGQRTGTSAAQFLKIGVGARAVAMGESYIAVANDAEALYWNPAGLVLLENPAVIFAYNNWLVDTQLQFMGATLKLDDYNAVGVAITYLYTDDMEETTELQPLGTGRTFSYSDFLLSLSYSRYMTDQFSFGVSTKFMQETIFNLTMRAVLFDLGIYYNVGWQSIRFAMVVSNFGSDMSPDGSLKVQSWDSESKRIDSFQSFPPPIMLRIGLAAEVYEVDFHKVTTSLQLNHPNDNEENINLGVEYSLYDKIAFRGGFKTAQAEEGYSLGFGLHFPVTVADFRFDYALTDFGRLGYVNRFAVQLHF